MSTTILNEWTGYGLANGEHLDYSKAIAGALHGIATSAIKEVGKQLEYNREHADEIQERQIKKDRETMRHSFWMFIISILVVGGIIGFCIYMGEKEKAEKQNNTGVVIVQQYTAVDSREKHAL